MEQLNQPNLRRAVWKIILRNDMPTRVLGSELAKQGYSSQDQAFARELLSGSIRWQISLDVIAHAYTKGRIRNELALRALRLGLYQLLCMNSVADHAAINETISAAKPELGNEAKFVNAVLRSTARGVVQRTSATPETNIFKVFSVAFSKSVFADPKKNASLAISQQFSFPLFLTQRWVDLLGQQKCQERMMALNGSAQLWQRMNLCKSDYDEVCKKLNLESGVAVNCAEGFVEGEWAVQDITSWQTAMMANPKPGERVLDLCAAPGGKSFAIYEATGGNIELHACDVSLPRLETMMLEAERLGHKLEYHHISTTGDNLPSGEFDLILCDVPCSNSGVFNKRAEARHRFSKKYLHEVETLQNVFRKKILSKVVTEKTRVLYSTCSLEPEENSAMAARIAKDFSKEKIDERVFEPTLESAGGYAALIY
ncbi:MAG: hypothetical protein H8E25_07835 [Planctomycetes bacterium]|nr:hypothetical protein [Planctomycetota bacterium]